MTPEGARGRRAGPPRAGLAAVSLEIGRVLASRDGVTFRAQGTCMYPAVRPGDVLSIRPCAAAEVAVGDIAVCRRPGLLFGHRVIATGVEDGRAFVVTRPDRAAGADDGPTFDDDLLGVVDRITRHGAPVPPRPVEAGPVSRVLLRPRLALIECRPRVRARALTMLAGIQRRVWYRRLAMSLVALARPRLTYTVRAPLNATLGDDVFRRVAAEEFDPEAPWNGKVRARWTLAVYVARARRPAATATCVRAGDHAWRLDEVRVRQRYQGLGLEHVLRARVADLVTRGRAVLVAP